MNGILGALRPNTYDLPAIDEAHRAIHATVNKFMENEAVTMEDLLSFKRLVLNHFVDEEELMRCCTREEQLRHLDSHHAFYETICSLQRGLVDQGRIDRQEVQLMLTWFIVHSSSHDAILVRRIRDAHAVGEGA